MHGGGDWLELSPFRFQDERAREIARIIASTLRRFELARNPRENNALCRIVEEHGLSPLSETAAGTAVSESVSDCGGHSLSHSLSHGFVCKVGGVGLNHPGRTNVKFDSNTGSLSILGDTQQCFRDELKRGKGDSRSENERAPFNTAVTALNVVSSYFLPVHIHQQHRQGSSAKLHLHARSHFQVQLAKREAVDSFRRQFRGDMHFASSTKWLDESLMTPPKFFETDRYSASGAKAEARAPQEVAGARFRRKCIFPQRKPIVPKPREEVLPTFLLNRFPKPAGQKQKVTLPRGIFPIQHRKQNRANEPGGGSAQRSSSTMDSTQNSSYRSADRTDT